MSPAELLERLQSAPRVIIAGGPRTGKSTLAVRLSERRGIPCMHADSLVDTHEWSEGSAEVATWFDSPGEWVVEGVSVPRALRKWLDAHPGQPVPAVIVWLERPIQVQSKGAAAMHKGCITVWREILPELRRRDAAIVERDRA